MKFNIYVLLLLVMFIITVKSAGLSIRAPRKIRAAGIAVSMLAFFRYIALTVLFTADNILFLYMLKPFVYLQYIYIPVIAVSTIYILMKKSRFAYVFLTLASLIVFYMVLIFNFPAKVEYLQGFGYIMNLGCQYFIDWIYFSFNICIFMLTIILLKPKHLVLVKIASAVSSIEMLFKIYSIPMFINPLVGELLWLAALIYALTKVRRQA